MGLAEGGPFRELPCGALWVVEWVGHGAMQCRVRRVEASIVRICPCTHVMCVTHRWRGRGGSRRRSRRRYLMSVRGAANRIQLVMLLMREAGGHTHEHQVKLSLGSC